MILLSLLAKGFSESEAENLKWLISQKSYGQIYGAIAGFGLFEFSKKYIRNALRDFYGVNQTAKFLIPIQLLVIGAGYSYGQYYYVGNREGVNNPSGNFLTNNHYQAARKKLLYFHPLN